jgi:transposase InsO family protein
MPAFCHKAARARFLAADHTTLLAIRTMGLDQVGPLPKSSRGGHTYLLVAVDKFSKWIEAALVTNQEVTTAVKFFESITCRYGVPSSIITDNGMNFTFGEFQEFAKEQGIKIKYASVAHP